MTLQKSLEAVEAAAAGVVLDAALALACLRFHLDLEAGFWFALLLMSVASLADAARKRRTILRGGTVSLPPSRNNDSLVAWISMSVVCWMGVMFHVPGLVTGLLLIITFVCLGVIVDALQTRRKIIRGIPLYQPKPEDKHSRYAEVTAMIIGLAIIDIAVTLGMFWFLLHKSNSPNWIAFGVLLAILWGIWIGFYRMSMSKSLLLWSRRPVSGSAEVSSPRFDLPPMTWRGLQGPVLAIIGNWLPTCVLAPFVISMAHGHIQVAKALWWAALYFSASVVLALIYVALVAFLTWLNSKNLHRREMPPNPVV